MMQIKYFDAHCHIQFDAYEEDAVALIEQMRMRAVGGIIVGVDLDSSKKAIALAEKHEHLFASVGLHPNRVQDEAFELKEFRELATHPKVVAIGECGLDYFRPKELTEETKRAQAEVLKAHIEIAGALNKPLIIHSRPTKGTQDAYQDLIVLLSEAKKTFPHLKGDIHFFVGGIAEMQSLTALDFTVSFTAVVTFTHDYDAVIRAIPSNMILSETDAPYVAPASRRGQRNDPLAVEEVVRKIAEIRGEKEEIVRKQLLENSFGMFTLTAVEAS